MSIPAAARVDDPIGHSPTKMEAQRAGFDIGLIVEVALLVGTGGGKKLLQGGVKVAGKGFFPFIGAWAAAAGEFVGGIADMMDGAILGHWLGGLFGAWVDDSVLGGYTQKTGQIKEGASRTFVESKAAARMKDPVMCTAGGDAMKTLSEIMMGRPSAGMNLVSNLIAMASGQSGALESGIGGHGGSTIADGSFSVRIEDKLAARVGDGTTCDAIITKGAERTYFGGPKASALGSENRTGAGFGADTALGVFRVVSSFLSLLGSGLKSLKNGIGRQTLNADLVSVGVKTPTMIFNEWLMSNPAGMGLKTLLGAADRANKVRSGFRGSKSKEEIFAGTGFPTAVGKTTKGVSDAVKAANKTGTPIFLDPDNPDGF